jgi:hypothetical protein
MPVIQRMSARTLQTLYSKRFDVASDATKALIAAGRGEERFNETRAKTDKLSLRFLKAHDSFHEVVREKEARRRWHGGDQPIKKSPFA